jgi:CelD/BcsL family acetyltransferase involved in cellulose biosynthesis
MTDNKEKSNVIPLMPNKKARDIVKAQFDNPPATRVQEHLDKINRTMDELRQLAAKQTGAEIAGEIPRYGSEAVVQTEELAATLPSADELEREYRRKQDAAKKKRLQNNRSVTRDYNLNNPRRPPRK